MYVPKNSRPKCLDNFRGISLISVLAKWYMTGLMVLVRERVHQMRLSSRWSRIMVFGFEQHHRCEHIFCGLNILIQRSLEWGQQKPIYIASADVKAAFDYLRPLVVLESLQCWHFHPRLIAALMKEACDLECSPSVADTTSEDTFHFNKSVRQGGVESAWEWNLPM